MSYFPQAGLKGETVTLEEPLSVIAHYLDDLERFRATYNVEANDNKPVALKPSVDHPLSSNGACDKETFDHLGLLFEWVKTSSLKTRIDQERCRHAKGLCTYPMLWLLFKPGTTVYMESDGRLLAYVIKRVEPDEGILSSLERSRIQRQLDERPEALGFQMWNLGFDGRFVGRSLEETTIPKFEGERPIKSLRIVPVDIIDKEDGGQTRRHLEEQGKRWLELLRGAQSHYSGRLESSSGNLVRCNHFQICWSIDIVSQFQGRIYVNSRSYIAQEPLRLPSIHSVDDFSDGLTNCLCDACHGLRPHPPDGFPWALYNVIDPLVGQKLEDPKNPNGPNHRYLLCERTLWGLFLETRKWGQAHSGLHELSVLTVL